MFLISLFHPPYHFKKNTGVINFKNHLTIQKHSCGNFPVKGEIIPYIILNGLRMLEIDYNVL